MDTATQLKIEYVPLESIAPYAGNAKLHPQEQIEQIKKSIELMGFDDPIAIWKNGEIIEGHGRYEAAKQLGMDTVPIIRLDDLTDDQRRAYALIHNKLTMNSGFDMETLEIELAEIQEVDMEVFSFECEPVVFDTDFDDSFSLPDGDKSDICTMTFTVHSEQKSLIEYAMSLVADSVTETFGNTNKNGNALYEVVRQWAEQRK